MDKPWIIEYRPDKLSAVIGQEKAVLQIRKFLDDFKKQKKKALLLYGQSGTGKTSSVVASAKEFGYELLEINASDNRNKKNVEELLGSYMKQQSLFFDKKMVLVDEIDGLSGNSDRGGVSALAQLIKQANIPIILTANDAWSQKLKAVRSACTLVQFDKLKLDDIYSRLKEICTANGIEFDDVALRSLARKSDGDLRAALNDLETISRHSKLLKKEHIDDVSEREKKESILNALVKVFKNSDPKIALSATENIDEDLDELIMWVDENLPKEYSAHDLEKAYDFLSKADVFRSRIKKREYWRFLVYVNAFSTAGIAVSKKEKYKQFITYKRSERILKIWIANQKLAKKKSIAEKLAKKTHCSKKVAVQNLPYLYPALANGSIAEELELQDEEIEYIKKYIE
ncbi:replication factor C large subunit [Candidatus Woesearchaeota archaeon]|nr:replication factor C large subunit [Candidatus Woesearchaeota archaeon]